VRRVTTWPAFENVTELCDMTRLLQTMDMCAYRANVSRLLADVFRRILVLPRFYHILFSQFKVIVERSLLFITRILLPAYLVAALS
jgi:hypothetical protein